MIRIVRTAACFCIKITLLTFRTKHLVKSYVISGLRVWAWSMCYQCRLAHWLHGWSVFRQEEPLIRPESHLLTDSGSTAIWNNISRFEHCTAVCRVKLSPTVRVGLSASPALVARSLLKCAVRQLFLLFVEVGCFIVLAIKLLNYNQGIT